MAERLVSAVAVVSIAETTAGREQVEAECFTPVELAELRGRAVQSLAGWLALKRALADLSARLGRDSATPRDFVLTRAASGAPQLCRPHPLEGAVEPFISISHTRAWAYGLAVARVADEPG